MNIFYLTSLQGQNGPASAEIIMNFLILEMEEPVHRQGWIYFVNKKHQSFVIQVETSCTSSINNTSTQKRLHILLYHSQQVRIDWLYN